MGRRRRSLLSSKATGLAPTAVDTDADDVDTEPEPEPEPPPADVDEDAETLDTADEPLPEPEPSYVSYEEPASEPEPEAPPGEPSYVSYEEPPQDAPYAKDLFGDPGYDDFDAFNPPTEEIPSGVMEDVSQTYNSPYTVPEPPPIPGILDRFTPPPAQRTDLGSRGKRRDKPEYLDDTPAGARDREVLEIGIRGKQKAEPPPRERARDDDEGGGPSVGLFVVGVGLLCIVVVGVGLMSMMNGGGGGVTDDVATREPTSGSLEVRSNMTQKPGLIGVDDPDAEVPVELPPPMPEPEQGTAEVPEPEAPTPSPEPKQPTPPPRPQPQTAPTPPPAPVAVAKATLKIRSNRRVLVYVNDQAIGFTPQDYEVEPGSFTVIAMIAGQPDTKQTRDASVGEAGSTVEVDFTF